jgi:hypothetical protein
MVEQDPRSVLVLNKPVSWLLRKDVSVLTRRVVVSDLEAMEHRVRARGPALLVPDEVEAGEPEPPGPRPLGLDPHGRHIAGPEADGRGRRAKHPFVVHPPLPLR